MVYLRNILLLLLRFCINTCCRVSGATFRFEFDHIRILEKNYQKNADFYFIQVGANDGVLHDDLFYFVKERNSKGLVIEPLKYYYKQLVKNYGFNRQIIAVNKAVHTNKKEVFLFKVNPAQLHLFPNWAGGIASFDKAHLLNSGIPDEAIITETTAADHFMSVYEQYYPYEEINLVQIDVEGYDLEVLKMVDFNSIKAEMIKLEYKNLPQADAQECLTILRKYGYYCFFQLPDLIGVKLDKLKL